MGYPTCRLGRFTGASDVEIMPARSSFQEICKAAQVNIFDAPSDHIHRPGRGVFGDDMGVACRHHAGDFGALFRA